MTSTASRGRGRGRGLLLVKRDNLPAVGKSGDATPTESKNTQNSVGLSDIEAAMNGMSLDPPENELKNFQQMTDVFVKEEKDLKNLVDVIYNKCLSNKEFGRTGAIICNQNTSLEVQGIKFRNCLLGRLQGHYKGRSELRESSKEKFVSFFCLLCQVFHNMKTATGENFHALVVPIFDCLELILDAEDTSDDELEALLLQVQIIGKELENVSLDRMSGFMEKTRSKIIRDGCSPRGRCTLLELVECYARKWEGVPNEITRYYCDTMADILTGMVI